MSTSASFAAAPAVSKTFGMAEETLKLKQSMWTFVRMESMARER